MRQEKWVVFGVALGMMAATAGWLGELKEKHLIGRAGVKLGPVLITNELGALVATQGVVLPDAVLDTTSIPMPIRSEEVAALPEDTSFGRRLYQTHGFQVENTVVVMGTDHTSIHQPQYCLYAQDWHVTKTERIKIRMARPFAYDIPAVKLTASKQFPSTNGPVTWSCLYVYWFVSGDETDPNKITAEEGSRLWSGWMDTLRKGEVERWAYISYFAPCQAGDEAVTFDHLEKIIQAGVPEFQLVAGEPLARVEAH